MSEASSSTLTSGTSTEISSFTSDIFTVTTSSNAESSSASSPSLTETTVEPISTSPSESAPSEPTTEPVSDPDSPSTTDASQPSSTGDTGSTGSTLESTPIDNPQSTSATGDSGSSSKTVPSTTTNEPETTFTSSSTDDGDGSSSGSTDTTTAFPSSDSGSVTAPPTSIATPTDGDGSSGSTDTTAAVPSESDSGSVTAPPTSIATTTDGDGSSSAAPTSPTTSPESSFTETETTTAAPSDTNTNTNIDTNTNADPTTTKAAGTTILSSQPSNTTKEPVSSPRTTDTQTVTRLPSSNPIATATATAITTRPANTNNTSGPSTPTTVSPSPTSPTITTDPVSVSASDSVVSVLSVSDTGTAVPISTDLASSVAEATSIVTVTTSDDPSGLSETLTSVLSVTSSLEVLSDLTASPTLSVVVAALDDDQASSTNVNVHPGTTRTIGESGSVATVVFVSTMFSTSTEPDGSVTFIPTQTTVVTTTTSSGRLQPQDPFTRNRSLIITGTVLGTILFVIGIISLVWMCRRRKQRLQLRGEDPLLTREEEDSRLGRVLIPGKHMTGVGVGTLTKSKGKREEPLASEVDDVTFASGSRDVEKGEHSREVELHEAELDEEEGIYYIRPPLVLPVMQREEYGSIMATLHEFGWLPDRSTSGNANGVGAALGRSRSKRSIVSAHDVFAGGRRSPESARTKIENPFSDDNEVTVDGNRVSSSSDGSTVYYPVSLVSRPVSPFDQEEHRYEHKLAVDTNTAARMHGGRSSTNDLLTGSPATPTIPTSSSKLDSSSDLPPPVRPFSISKTSNSSASSLLNPPTRPQFLGRLSDLVRSEVPPTLPPIEPVASPAESEDSYRADGLLHPSLFARSQRGCSSDETHGSLSRSDSSSGPSSGLGHPGHQSVESLYDHVDYTRPMSLINFRHPTSSTMNSVDSGKAESITTSMRHEQMAASPVRNYHNILLAGRLSSVPSSSSQLDLDESSSH